MKFNQASMGDIVIIVQIKPSKEPSHRREGEKTFVMETQVLDTGSGIDHDRKDLLFEPLNEIKNSIGASKY